MNVTEQHIHQRILAQWQNFPWKLDYVFYLLLSKNKDITDIQLEDAGKEYIVSYVRHIQAERPNFDSYNFFLEKDELLNYLGIEQVTSDFHDFSFTTKIFINEYRFRVQKSSFSNRDFMAFRLLDRFHDANFNNKLDTYNLEHDLRQELPINNGIIEKRIKV